MADFEYFTVRPAFADIEPARDYLNQIADFLTTHPDAWSRGAFARTADGSPCDPRSPEARTFCAIGLLQKFVALPYQRVCEQLLSYAITPGGTNRPMSPAGFNDTRARFVDDIIAMFRCAALVRAIPRCGCAACTTFAAQGADLLLQFSPAEMPNWLKLATPANEDERLLLQVEESVAA